MPSHDGLLVELAQLRQHGLGKVRRLALSQLHAACQLCDLTDGDTAEPAAVEALLRQAVELLGGGRLGDAAEYTFGLVQGTKLLPPSERRKQAAGICAVSVDRFRKAYEPEILEQTAEAVLALCHDARLRTAKRDMERRHPADSRLAVQWVERFEAYYRVWTPAYALAANLEAAVQTYREEPSDHLPWDPDSAEAYDPADQANGYARYGLYAYARFQLEVKKFITKHGGLWLLSDVGVEQQVADAIYRIGWHNPLNEDDNSWLRRFLADARHEEPQHFAQMLKATSIGSQTLDEWQAYVASCQCNELEHGEDGCQVHATIRACREYCDLIDHDWLRIADWYRPGSTPSRGIDGVTFYRQQVDAAESHQ